MQAPHPALRLFHYSVTRRFCLGGLQNQLPNNMNLTHGGLWPGITVMHMYICVFVCEWNLVVIPSSLARFLHDSCLHHSYLEQQPTIILYFPCPRYCSKCFMIFNLHNHPVDSIIYFHFRDVEIMAQ